MVKLKRTLLYVIILVALIGILLNSHKIKQYIKTYLETKKIVIKPGNEYTRNYNYLFVTQEDDYIPYSYNDLLNIIYSTLNQGWTEFTFYCPVEYEECLNDINKISLDEDLLSNINNFIHPYNSFSSVRTIYDEYGEVKIIVEHQYNDYEIQDIDKQIDKIIAKETDNTQSDYEKIKALHDYIINRTKYDTVRENTGTSKYDSARIQGVLNDKYAICSGYTDLMAVMLDKLGIKNYKISSDHHVWNAVYLDNAWYHLDLTWDDPVSKDGRDLISHDYFLITEKDLMSKKDDTSSHIYDHTIYKEFVK